jgi:hypothetical protein
MFIEAQGIQLTLNFQKQDDQSAIRLEKNGRRSAGKQSRHIDIQYFYVKNRIAQNGISIRHCANENMIADFFTKPVQGALFYKFRDLIMEKVHTSVLSSSPVEKCEERVGNDDDKSHSTIHIDPNVLTTITIST